MLFRDKITSMSTKNSDNCKSSRTWAEEVDVDSRGSFNSSISDGNDSRRNISLEFLDGVNEQKFEKLVKEEKLKTPFKRRHSESPSLKSRSNSPSSTRGSSNERDRNGYCLSSHKNEKRLRQNSYNSSSSSSSYTETDPAILSRRQKQIEYGKNTIAYERYIETVQRSARTRDHPRTPNKYGKYSRRAFDGLIKIWRKQLHYYDPPNLNRADKFAAQVDFNSDTDS